jgi:hypothetical protein
LELPASYSLVDCSFTTMRGGDMKRIHVIGSSPRSGTTLLTEALAACFEVDCASSHERSIAHPDPPGCGTHLTKQPGELLSVLLPLAIDPDLRVICCVRDPRDSAVSRHGSRPDVYWCGFRYWKLFLRYHLQLVSSPKAMLVRYEDLTREPDKVQERIAAFLPFLKRRHQFSEFHRVAQPHGRAVEALRELRAIEPSGIGVWREHLPRIKQQIELHGPITLSLVQHGYEPDASWERVLHGVEAGDFESAVGEYFDFRYIISRQLRGLRAARRAAVRRWACLPRRTA